MNGFQDAFISYGRADSKHFALKLYQALSDRDFKVWFDFEDIPLGVDFQNQIDDGIEKADNFLFLISPHSINSPYCRKEIELALKLNKRIIPLLHVEQIDRNTWQERHPNGTDAQWAEYQAKGLHSSFPNMHPAIGKINWVYFRENLDNFDTALTGLLDLFGRHRNYVRQHTILLAQALTWERHQKQVPYLLVGEHRTTAEDWLKIRFQDEQAPCTPTDLHSEYITESTKNANNLMTQVFLAYAHEDKAVMQKIRSSLRRESFTVWTNNTDIQTGEAAAQAIKRGIEQADNIVYLLSPHAVNSTYCQQELEYALALNKRIIPVLVAETAIETIPFVLRDLQHIDLTDNVEAEDYALDESQLLKVLHHEETYYSEHKQLLVKALKWQNQNQNPSILLRGYNLRSADAWLKIAQQRFGHPATEIQEQFIQVSLQQPPAVYLDVFISYSRADSDLARKLNDALQMQGKTTWFDQESIASGTEFQQEIYRGIEVSDNFVFIISPRSIRSPYCADEVEYAAKLNKRFVTILHQPVNPTELHPELAKIQWIDFNKSDADFTRTFGQLIRTLDIDRNHVHYHTKWSQRALEWQDKDQDPDLLLRGSEFTVAQDWLTTALEQTKHPQPTALQQEFLQASAQAITAAAAIEQQRQAELLQLQREKTKEAEARLAEQKKSAKRQKLFLSATTVGFVLSTFLGVVAFVSYGKALASRDTAQAAYAKAIAKSSDAFFASGKNLEALLEALRADQGLQAVRHPEQHPEIKDDIKAALQKSLYSLREHNRFDGHIAPVNAVAYSPDGELVVSGGEDNKIIIWQRNGKLLQTLDQHRDSVEAIAFSPDSQYIVSASIDQTIKLWQRDGTLIASWQGQTNDINSVTFSPDGLLLASAGADKKIKLWRRDGTLVRTFEGHTDEVQEVVFSPNGKFLASASSDQTVKIWQLDGELRQTLTGHRDEVTGVAFSPDGLLLASSSNDATVKIWQLDGKLLQTLIGHENAVRSVKFHPNGEVLASGSWDQTMKLWTLEGTVLETYTGYTNKIEDVAFSPEGDFIASANQNGIVTIWRQHQRFLNYLSEHDKAVNQVAFSPDGALIASASGDRTLKLWHQAPDKRWKLKQNLSLIHDDGVEVVVFSPDSSLLVTGGRDRKIRVWHPDGTLLHEWNVGTNIRDIAFSPDNQTIAIAGNNHHIQLRDRSGRLLHTLEGHRDAVRSVTFSPDGKHIASGSTDNTVRLWSSDGELLTTLTAHKGPITSVQFSPDNQKLVTGSEDKQIKLWQIESGQLTQLLTFEQHSDIVTDVAFSPDGQILASTGADNTIKLWRLDGTVLRTLYGHRNIVNDVAFHPTADILISASNDHKVIVWKLHEIMAEDMTAIKQTGCEWLQDFLSTNRTLEERDRQLCDGIIPEESTNLSATGRADL
ncbi:MAG: TIR domain-containing protein [Jaaginema sp. PMC 1079.18]|nr:TIR domain-containing protein [Jaaginema sp. PMC 1080.18]MEC4852414.1 TIR domain-containing protein [Jaaginema sp. PMC 1079.18]MEC4867264.1 TIR domain-containing protein [Jaaginema sp. PMC 1078.18]